MLFVLPVNFNQILQIYGLVYDKNNQVLKFLKQYCFCHLFICKKYNTDELIKVAIMRITLFKFKFLFFLSGAACLIYEVVWTRLFTDILGSTALSISTVFSVFLLGLAIGAYLFSRINVYGCAAFKLYVILEFGIALSAALVSAVLIFAKSWIAVHLPESDLFVLSLMYKFITVTLLIGIPTVLMGGTLPVMLNAVRDWTLPRQIVTKLYGWNTMGAASGTFLTGFVLIWQIGLSLTVSVGVGLNLLVCFLFFLMVTQYNESISIHPIDNKQQAQTKTTANERKLWFAFAFLSGFSILAYEMLWGRMAKFLLGDRTISITALLFIFIVCLGLGSFIAPVIARKFKAKSPQHALKLIAWILLIAGLLHLAIVLLADNTIQGHGLASIIYMKNEFIRRILTMWILVFPVITVLGLVFPILSWSASEINVLPGKVMGNLYFVNTLGATLGAVTANYALTQWLGTFRAFLFISCLLVAFSVVYLLINSRTFWEKWVLISVYCCNRSN